MIVPPRLQRALGPIRLYQGHTGTGVDRTDVRKWTAKPSFKTILEPGQPAGENRKAQFKIFPAVQGIGQGINPQGHSDTPRLRGDRNTGGMQLCPDATRLADMPQIARQTVADIELTVYSRLLT